MNRKFVKWIRLAIVFALFGGLSFALGDSRGYESFVGLGKLSCAVSAFFWVLTVGHGIFPEYNEKNEASRHLLNLICLCVFMWILPASIRAGAGEFISVFETKAVNKIFTQISSIDFRLWVVLIGVVVGLIKLVKSFGFWFISSSVTAVIVAAVAVWLVKDPIMVRVGLVLSVILLGFSGLIVFKQLRAPY